MSAGKIDADSKIVFVNDGSKDRTWEMICDLHKADPVFRGVCLSRNKGHQNALMAGLMTVKSECDAAISMDADLQDDINAIDEMVDRYLEGYEVVYGVRSSRKKDTFFKRTTAQGFYKVMRAMGVETVYNHADYRLMSRRALEALSEFEEVNLFLRGIVPLVGFKSTQVTYERGERFAGESKYPLKKMLAFATEGITSMSVRPIRLITTLGFLVFLFSLGVLVYSIVRKFTGYTVPGWAFLAVSIWALGGVQLLAIGVIGEYIGKIYLETKHRPKFIVAEYLNDD
jgi:glycosyltransferase involved in cell wall biosynthesis